MMMENGHLLRSFICIFFGERVIENVVFFDLLFAAAPFNGIKRRKKEGLTTSFSDEQGINTHRYNPFFIIFTREFLGGRPILFIFPSFSCAMKRDEPVSLFFWDTANYDTQHVFFWRTLSLFWSGK